MYICVIYDFLIFDSYVPLSDITTAYQWLINGLFTVLNKAFIPKGSLVSFVLLLIYKFHVK